MGKPVVTLPFNNPLYVYSLITKTHLVFFMAPKDFNDDILICYQSSHFLLSKKRHTISIKNIHRIIPCGCFLFTKLLCTFFQHFADWQMVRTSGFTFAAFYTGGSLHRKRTVTVSCPVSQPVTVKIACEQEHTRNIDSHTAWSTVITSAAEICSKLIPYCLNFLQFFLA